MTKRLSLSLSMLKRIPIKQRYIRGSDVFDTDFATICMHDLLLPRNIYLPTSSCLTQSYQRN